MLHFQHTVHCESCLCSLAHCIGHVSFIEIALQNTSRYKWHRWFLSRITGHDIIIVFHEIFCKIALQAGPTRCQPYSWFTDALKTQWTTRHSHGTQERMADVRFKFTLNQEISIASAPNQGRTSSPSATQLQAFISHNNIVVKHHRVDPVFLRARSGHVLFERLTLYGYGMYLTT